MASSFNRILIVGHLGKDPDMRYLPNSGDAVTDFSVATSERRKGQDGQQQEQTTWFRVSAFGKTAENCSQFLVKGSLVYVEGSLTQRDWTTRDGENRTSLEVRARDVRFLDKRPDQEEAPAAQDGGDANEDDLPF